MPVRFTRHEYRCRLGPAVAWLRRFNSAFVPRSFRRASGLQALQRCSGLLNRRARGSTVATHHSCIRGEIIIILRFERRVCRWESCRMHQFRRVSPTSRGAPLRTGRLRVQILHAAPIDRPAQSAHVAQRRGSAFKTRRVSVQLRPWAPTACSPMQRRSAQPGNVAGASPSTRTNLECPPVKRTGPRC